MLTSRKDAGTGHKLTLYWDKKPVPLDKYNEYWQKEINRHKYDLAKAEQANVDLRLDNEILQSLLTISQLKYKKVMTKGSL